MLACYCFNAGAFSPNILIYGYRDSKRVNSQLLGFRIQSSEIFSLELLIIDSITLFLLGFLLNSRTNLLLICCSTTKQTGSDQSQMS